MDKGIPRRIARYAAREELRTDVTDITVDARQRLNDLRRRWRGAAMRYRFVGFSFVNNPDKQLKMIREAGIIGKYEVPV